MSESPESHSEGQDALALIAQSALLLDARLLSLQIDAADDGPSLTLVFAPRADRGVARVILRGGVLRRCDFYYDDGNNFYLITRYTLLAQPDSGYYLSLDPWDDTASPHDEDRGVFCFSHLSIRISEPSPP